MAAYREKINATRFRLESLRKTSYLGTRIVDSYMGFFVSLDDVLASYMYFQYGRI